MGNAKVKAQVTIELTLSLILLLVFLVATVKIFVWLGNGIVKRHQRYEITRTAAGQAYSNTAYRRRSSETWSIINFNNNNSYKPEKLNIFSNW